jgi:hypothetical protein
MGKVSPVRKPWKSHDITKGFVSISSVVVWYDWKTIAEVLERLLAWAHSWEPAFPDLARALLNPVLQYRAACFPLILLFLK